MLVLKLDCVLAQSNILYSWKSNEKCTGNSYVEYSVEKYGEAYNPYKRYELSEDGEKFGYVIVSKNCNGNLAVLRLSANSKIVTPITLLSSEAELNQFFKIEESEKSLGLLLKDANNQPIEAFTLKDKAEKEVVLIGYAVSRGLPLSVVGNRVGSDEVSKMMMEYVNSAKNRFGGNLTLENKHTLMQEAQKIRNNGSNIQLKRTPSKSNGQVLILTPIYKELASPVKVFDVNGKIV